MAPIPQLILDADTLGLAVRLTFNDIRLTEIRPGQPVRYSARLGGWAQAGANPLEVTWQAAGGGETRLIVKVRETQDENGRELVRFERPEGAPPAGRFVDAVSYQPPQRWKWLDADRLAELTPADRAGIEALLRSLHALLSAKDIDGLVKAQAMQVGEQAIAAGTAPEQSLEAYRAFLTERMGGAGWHVEPLNVAGLRMTLMGGGRVVEVTGADGGPAIFSRSEEGMFAMAPYVSRFGGVWAVVR